MIEPEGARLTLVLILWVVWELAFLLAARAERDQLQTQIDELRKRVGGDDGTNTR